MIVSERPVAPALGELAADWSGQCVGFVHITKTAGTSLTAALTEAVGVLPLVLLTDEIGVPESRWNASRFGFWPLITGHMAASRFPTTHRLITTMREPRSRLLSSYRQTQRHRSRSGLPMSPIGECLQEGNFDLMAMYFLTPGLWARGNVLSRSPGVTADLAQGLSRLSGASWSDDTHGMERMIAAAAGRRVSIPQLNVAGDVSNDPLEVGLAELEAAAAADLLLVEVATAMGLLPRREDGWADQHLEKTARRLNVTLT